ncbi:hypothetical protein EYD45_03910 [Hyunsoonleella flava]|uniref:Uncharacterized protein n=1 Tax=Hyunsoonleella flava TaxID=2527939 RepID=A0A4Q9FIS6_9FLAO|nr:hypothetical protein [Hyunsoonleella flava]TBN05432.1 hypothetical protein EYD45_03910 [Hyunsoonleella flava]
MNTKKILMCSGIVLFALSLSSFKLAHPIEKAPITYKIQEGFIVYATYDGQNNDGYNFVVTDKKGKKNTLTFQNIEEPVLSVFDLSTDTFVGTKFKVTFNKEMKASNDEVNTITKLEKL